MRCIFMAYGNYLFFLLAQAAATTAAMKASISNPGVPPFLFFTSTVIESML